MDSLLQEKTSFFAQSIRNRLGDEVLKVVLFGSRARGNHHDGSDYDFLVVIRHKDKLLRNLILDTEVDFLNKYDELTGTLVLDEAGWEKQKNNPLGINITREGISL